MKKWKCTVCGYIHTGDEPPEKCPVCGAPKSMFIDVTEPEAPAPEPEAAVAPEPEPETGAPEEAKPVAAAEPVSRMTSAEAMMTSGAFLTARPLPKNMKPNDSLENRGPQHKRKTLLL